MYDVFMSYARVDCLTADALVEKLEGRGFSVWKDNKNAIPGSNWHWEIQNAIEKAKCVLVLWSKSSIVSDYVISEAYFAKIKDKLIPLVIDDDVDIPFDFQMIQALPLIDWDGEPRPELEKLFNAINQIGGHPPKLNEELDQMISIIENYPPPLDKKNDIGYWNKRTRICKEAIGRIVEINKEIYSDTHLHKKPGAKIIRNQLASPSEEMRIAVIDALFKLRIEGDQEDREVLKTICEIVSKKDKSERARYAAKQALNKL